MRRLWLASGFCVVFGCGKSDPSDASSGGSPGMGGTGGRTQTSGGSSASGGVAGDASGGKSASTGGNSLGTGGSAGDAPSESGGRSSGGNSGSAITLPEANASFDYQIGEAYAPPEGVQIVSRDRESSPAPGLYNICYVNGFQTQPQDNESWLSEHPDLIAQDGSGEPILDEDWGEYLLDTSTEAKREALLDIVGPWIVGCKESGFDAVEVDNLDSYSRSNGALTENDNVAFMAMLGGLAHAEGLAVGQKNSAELLNFRSEMGTDFAVSEECNRWDECADYQEAYGDLVFIIEYRKTDFDKGCGDFPELSIVLRDLNVTGPGSSSYVYDGC